MSDDAPAEPSGVEPGPEPPAPPRAEAHAADAPLLLREVIDDVDTALRQLLRDLPAAPEAVRLRALVPGELDAAEVLTELRRHDRLSIPLAASLHELFDVRRRLAAGEAPSAADVERVLLTADRLEQEVVSRRATGAASAYAAPPALGVEPHVVEPPGAAGRRPLSRASWIGAGVGLLALVLALGGWWAQRPDRSQLEQGIALFRSGAYADAASYFFRYAQANADDPTPHLYLARIHRRMERPALAADELRILLRMAPEDPAVHRELGFFLLDAGRAEPAVERFRDAVGRDPDAAAGWIGLVRALRAAGRSEAAERVLQQAPAEVREMVSAAPPPLPLR